MAEAGYHQLKKLTECCICLKEFTEPRMLPCIHTFCLGCIKQLPYKTESLGRKGWPTCTRNTMPCPLCRKVFTIPSEGLDGLQKNFFMEHLMEITQNFKLCKTSSISCDICKCLYQGGEQTKTATMRCLDCRDNFCELCAKAHTLHKSSISHHIVKIGSETDEDMRRISPTRRCNLHNQKTLDYYCPKCRKIFCVSCVLENHATHGCKDVSTVEEKFRKIIEENASKFSTYASEILPKLIIVRKNKESILIKLANTEREIRQRQWELKELIDKHTASLLDELSQIKQKHVKDCENDKEEIEHIHTILNSFEIYCAELASKGSASDICGCVDELNSRANELERDHEEFIGRSSKRIEVSFTAGNLSNGNVVGQLQESLSQIENCVVIAGISNGVGITKGILKVNLHRSQLNRPAHERLIPTTMKNGLCAAVYNNTLYVAGLGNNSDEIWKYCLDSGWTKCAFLVQCRSGHCMEFIDEILYICGGYITSVGTVLDSVEAYNAVSNTCKIVGKLLHRVQHSGNCVPYKSSLYIFGGRDDCDRALNCVQMYDTKRNVCTLLSKPMPSSQEMMRAVPWQNSVILIGYCTCYVFNLETETWQERKQFKTDLIHFGLALENERLFIIGGGKTDAPDETGKYTWMVRDDIKYVPLQSFIDDKPVEWKLYAKLGSPALVQAYGKVSYNIPGKSSRTLGYDLLDGI